jgi:hypothetical protein
MRSTLVSVQVLAGLAYGGAPAVSRAPVAGRAHDATAVYTEDLRRSPENAWGLAGRAAALRAERSPDADQALRRLDAARPAADVAITGSLLP